MIGIVGAGIMGRTLAWHLTRSGFNVSLFDKDCLMKPKNCSYVAAGMISPFAEITGSYPSLVAFGRQAIDFWQKAILSFSSKVFFSAHGTLCIAHSEHQNDLGHFKQTLLQKESSSDFHLVQIHEIESEIDQQFRQGIFLPKEAQISAQMLLPVLVDELKKQKSELYSKTRVLKIKKNEVITSERKIKCDFVIDCRGLEAGDELKTLRGVRGELIWVEAPTVYLKHMIRVFHPRAHVYIIPRPEHQFILGASCIDANDMSPISVRTVIELLSTAYSVHKGFAEARILSTKVHCRPAFENNLPRIFLDQDNKIIRINGLYRHGYLFAPIFVEAVEYFLKMGAWPKAISQFIQEV